MNRPDFARWLRASAVLLLVTACGGGGGGGGTPTPSPVQATAPSITAAPAALTVDDGAAASFSVTAQGSGTLSYQWSRNGALIAGATSTTLTLAAVQFTTDQGAQFSVTITNAAGSVTSAAATLTVKPLPVSLEADLPDVVQAEAGTSRSFSIAARGSQPLTLQWLRDGVPIAGATSTSYTTPKLQLGDDGTRISVQVGNAAGAVLSQASRIGIAAGKTTVIVTGCREITQPGHYVLDRDIAASNANSPACIDIHDTSDVLLDCADHEIANATRDYAHAVHVTHSERVSLRRCRVRADWNELRDVRDVSIIDNIIKPAVPSKPSIFNVETAERLRFAGNQLTGSYQHVYASDSTISHNRVKTVPTEIVAALLTLNLGSNNRVTDNQLDGNWDSSVSGWNGADDGIIMADESSVLVRNNQIVGVWDCGIEWMGDLNNATVQGNQISRAAYCGIGGWYFSSLHDTKFLDNRVERSGQLFSLFRAYCLRPAGWDPRKLMPADTVIRLENNRFENNRFSQPLSGPESPASYFNFAFAFGVKEACSQGYKDQMPQPSDFRLKNNVFKDNDFGGAQRQPYFDGSMQGAIVDGGGNICKASTETAYPLKCNPPPKP